MPEWVYGIGVFVAIIVIAWILMVMAGDSGYYSCDALTGAGC